MTSKNPTDIKNMKRKKRETGKKQKPRVAKARVTPGSAKVMMGDDDPRTWDDEELLHGRRRSKGGGFKGRDPLVVPREVYDETIRRSMRNADRSMRAMQKMALEQLNAIVVGEDVEDRDRLNAIKLILERTIGKTPDRIEVSAQSDPWEQLVIDAIVDIGDEDDGSSNQ